MEVIRAAPDQIKSNKTSFERIHPLCHYSIQQLYGFKNVLMLFIALCSIQLSPSLKRCANTRPMGFTWKDLLGWMNMSS